MLFRAAILLATLLVPFAGFAAAEPARPVPPKTTAVQRLPPMIFYLAKGESGACGTDCSEWIAAEGQIETGSAQQLRAFLTQLGRRKLPIFFHSPGGNVIASIAMGRLLRERDMTAGVSETVPVGCTGASAQACRALKQSGQVLPATLRNVSACNSACVFALIGAKVRYVPPGARLGVHSSKVVIFRLDGGKLNASSKQIASLQRSRLAELNVDTRRYVQEMKVDVRLFELAAKIPHEDVHYLTREEIVGFGIDPRGASEARWIAAEVMPQRLWAMKFFVETSGEGKNELRSNMIRMECVSQRYTRLGYFRGLGSGASGLRRKIELSMEERRIPLSGGLFFKVDAIESGTSFELWSAELPLDLIEAAGARAHVEIRETESTGETAHVTRLSTAGLSQAVGVLRERCKSMPDCPQVSAGIGGNTAAPQSGWAAGAVLPKAGGTASSSWSGDTGSLNCAAMQVR
jgi:hypothetical protein